MTVSILLACVLTSVAGDVRESRGDVSVVRDLTYAVVSDVELQLDLFIPRDSVAPPLLIWIHGGGWRGGSRRHPPLEVMTRHGYAVASISYRFSQQAVFPAQIHDCKAAVRWLRRHGSSYGYSTEKIGVAGSSAGGHLAVLLAVSSGVEELEGAVGECPEESSAVDAVINYFGPTDFVLRGRTQPERAYTQKSGSFALLGGVSEGALERKMEIFASPVTYVGMGDPPLLTIHGTADRTVLPDQAERLAMAYRSAGLSESIVLVEGAGHGGRPFFSGDLLAAAVRFLDDHFKQDSGFGGARK